MSDAKPSADLLQPIPEDALWADDSTKAEDPVYKLLPMLFAGLVIRAPRRAAGGGESPIPLLFAVGQSTKRSMAFPLNRNAVVLVSRLGRGESWVGPLILPPKNKILPTTKPEPLPDDADGLPIHSTWVQRFDLTRLRADPWEPGEVALRVINYDSASNAEVVAVEGDDPVHEVPDPARWTQWQQVQRGTAETVPSFVPTEHTPDLGEGPGLALAFPHPVRRSGEPTLISGAVRLPLHPLWVAWTDPAVDNDQPLEQPTALDAPRLTAVVPLTLLLVRPNITKPVVVPLGVPLFSRAPLAVGQTVEGTFAYDLTALLGGFRLPPAEYLAYLVAGPYLAGPHQLTVEPPQPDQPQ